MKDVDDSFSKFIDSETIQDYKCDACEKRGVTKRDLLKALPNVLILHLKRFTFDMQTFRQVKVNTKFEFPEELNLEPYTMEGIQWREQKAQKDSNQEDMKNSLPKI